MVDFKAILVRAGFQMKKAGGYTGYTDRGQEFSQKSKDIEEHAAVTNQCDEVVTVVTETALLEDTVTTVTAARKPVVTSGGEEKEYENQGVAETVTAVTSVTTNNRAESQTEIGEDEKRALAMALGNIPAAYAEAFAKLLEKAPADVPAKRWLRCIRDGVEFLDEWGEIAARLRYSPNELFGIDPVAPVARYDKMGMLWLLKGERVVALTEIEARLSSGLAFHRKAEARPPAFREPLAPRGGSAKPEEMRPWPRQGGSEKRDFGPRALVDRAVRRLHREQTISVEMILEEIARAYPRPLYPREDLELVATRELESASGFEVGLASGARLRHV
jgi:hypothetical protein